MGPLQYDRTVRSLDCEDARAGASRRCRWIERDDLSSNRHPALHYWWSMIPAFEPVKKSFDGKVGAHKGRPYAASHRRGGP